MTKIKNPLKKAQSDEEVIKEHINLQFHWYMIVFFIVYLGSFILPGIVLVLYLILFINHVLNVTNFILLFTNLNSLLVSIGFPLIIIGCYLLHLLLVALITKGLWNFTEKRSPSKDGIIPRNVQSKTQNYYHIRSFMIKYPKNSVVRGPFPWLINWLYNTIGSTKVGKGTVIEENIGADRFVEFGKNCYIGPNGAISSHSVSGVFGNINYFKIKLEDNFTTGGFNCVGPGSHIGKDTWILPMSGGTKHNVTKGESFYFGTPMRKVFRKRLMDYLKLTEEDFKRAEELRERRRQAEIKNKNTGEGK